MGVDLNDSIKYPETEWWFNGFGHGNVGRECAILIYSSQCSIS